VVVLNPGASISSGVDTSPPGAYADLESRSESVLKSSMDRVGAVRAALARRGTRDSPTARQPAISIESKAFAWRPGGRNHVDEARVGR